MDMGSTLPSEEDVWSLDRLRLPVGSIGDLSARSRPPRHKPGETFIKGPISFPWIQSACRLPGSGLHVAMVYRFLCCRFRPPNRTGLEAVANGLRISGRTARRGLHSAEMAGLLAVEREPGCKLAVSVLDRHGLKTGPELRPLYGPIPWRWWLSASRLPGMTLHVGAACWLLAGWERSACFELELDGWTDLGLSRFSASRGLDNLRHAGLASIVQTQGRSPGVTIMDMGAELPESRSGELKKV